MILLIIGLGISLMINENINLNVIQKSVLNDPKVSNGPNFIHIDGSITDNWSDTVDQYDWCYGEGTYEKPYIIENVTIDASFSPTGSGIIINNSKNEYFIIRNCTVFNADNPFPNAGIRLENTNNGTLTDNNCSNNLLGMYLNKCHYNNITGNTANNNDDFGIYFDGSYGNCDNIFISNNTVNKNGGTGMYFNGYYGNCGNNIIINNTINENDNDGMYFYGYNGNCGNNIIANNTINKNGGTGIHFYGRFGNCNNNIIANNTVNENDSEGMYFLYNCNYNTFINNTVIDNIGTGIFIHTSDENNITGNIIKNNSRYGIYLQHADHNDITENTINGNLNVGIFLYSHSDHNEIKNNTINKNDLGIRLDTICNYNNITGNTLQDNNWCIFETDCVGNIIKYNNCSSPTVELPILIDDYATGVEAHNWTWASNQTWCSGSGTEDIPYIIENLIISGFGIEDGITILNSNVSFIIRDCLISSAIEGIYLQNVNNSQLIGNNCSNNQNGIYLENSRNIKIFENVMNSNFYDGINIFECDYINITGNTANNNDGGISIDDSDYSNIIENIADGNQYEAIYLEECVNYTISGNIVNNNSHGIYMESSCYNITISKNSIINNSDDGIHLEYSDFNKIIKNNISNNLQRGIYVSNCHNNTIMGNNINDNTENGILLDNDCNNNTISENTLKNNNNGISLNTYCYYNNIAGNKIEDNLQDGILIVGGGEESSNYNDIIDNIFYNNSRGICLDPNSNNNSIYKNFFLKNGIHAIDNGTDNKWNSTTIGNYWDNHTGPDSTHDGIVDNPYTYIKGSAGSIDYLPIAEDGPPNITINSPSEENVFNLIAPSFNVEITDDYLESMWYTIDGGLNNYTFTTNSTINQIAWDSAAEGNVTITFYAKDIPGNIGTAGVSITKDTVSPVIIINSPVEGEEFGK
ncbi:MAG: nitrous oxide reductase family maturation protein NosD, partial [Promethearchaeota archaeon]